MKRILGVALVSLVVFASTDVRAAGTATAGSSVSVVTPISITNTTALRFGTIAKVVGGGWVRVDADGTRTVLSHTLLALTPSGPASFNVTGDPNETYAITYPASAVLTHTNATDSLTVTLVGYGVTSGTLDGDGTHAFALGGLCTIPGASPIGVYSGTFDVTVAYN